ncbi:MAG: hypothetical protein FJX77_01440, partial [Armatimonadetes bacterium]|nr:hypothetical protein [Armatimonadota bacterium]
MSVRPIRRLVPVLGLAGLATICSALPSGAQQPGLLGGPSRLSTTNVPGSMGIPQPEPMITLKISPKRSLARVLHEVFKQASGYDYRVAVSVPGQFTVDANNTPLSQVLRKIAEQDTTAEPLVLAFEKNLVGGGGTYVFHREYLELGLIEGEARFSASNARVTTLLPELFKLMKATYRIEPDVPAVLVTTELRPQTWEQVLPQIIAKANEVEPGLTYSKQGNMYVVHLHKSPTGITNTGQPVPGVQTRRATVSVVNTPLREAVNQLFQGSTWKAEVAPELQNIRVTYNVASYPELAALRDLLKLAAANRGPITYREGKGVLYIEPGLIPGQPTLTARRQEPTTMARTTSYTAPASEKLRAIVKILEGAYGVQIRVGPTVPDAVLTNFKIENATVSAALNAVVTGVRQSLPNLNVVSRSVDTN